MNFVSWFGNVHLAEWILNVSVQSTIILTISLLVRRVCGKYSAPTRSNICMMTMVILLVLPISSHLFRDLSPMRVDVNRSFTSIEEPESNTTDIVGSNLALNPILHQRESAIQNRGQHLLTYALNFLGMIWLGGTLLMTVRLGYGFAYTQKIISRLSKMKHDRLIPVFAAVVEVFGTTHPPSIYTSRWTKSPQTIGLFTPCIVLPSDFYEKTNDEELKSVLLHEMSHIYHNDQWTGLLQRIIGTVFWWNPLTSWLSADFSHEREYVCDMYVSRHGNPAAFANCLLNLARNVQAVTLLPTALCAIRSTGNLENRIRKIISGEQIMKTTLGTRTSLFHVMISIVVAGLLFSVNLTMADQPSTSPLSQEKVQKDRVVETPRSDFSVNVASLKIISKDRMNITAYKSWADVGNNTYTLIGNVVATIENSSDGMINTITSKKASVGMDKNQDIKEAIFEGDVEMTRDNFNCKAKKIIVSMDENGDIKTIVEGGTFKQPNLENVTEFQSLKIK